MAEWLCSGLQIRERRFDSDLSLVFLSLCPGGGIGRHTRLKILRLFLVCRFDSGPGQFFLVHIMKRLLTGGFWHSSFLLGIKSGYQIFKWMLPVVILVKLLDLWGATTYIDMLFAPVMQIMGLPEWTSIIWVSAILANLYAALAVMATSGAMETLTVAQLSILCTAILIAHSLPVEARIAQALGVRLPFILFIRLATALVLGVILNSFYTAFGFLQEPVDFTWQLGDSIAREEWWWNILLELRGLFLLVLLVVFLVILVEVLKVLGFVYWCELLMKPLLRVLGISNELAHIMAIGGLLGLTYGSGLLFAETRARHFSARDLAGALVFISMCHALIEDTLLMLFIGADLSAVLFARLFISLLIVALLMRIDENSLFTRRLFVRDMGTR